MSQYHKGRRLEYKVKKLLEKAGFTVFRCAGSKPIDLVAVKCDSDSKPIVLLVECKSSCILPLRERKKIRDLARKTGARPIFAYPSNNRIVFHDLFEKRR